MNGQTIELPDAPRIDGLRFRTFAGESDYPEMVHCIAEAAEGEGDWLSVDVMRSMDAFTPWVDVNKDRIIVEVGGKMIGAGRVQTGRNVAGERVYFHSFNLLPQWRGKGIGTAALLHNERRLREIAADHPDDGP